MCVRPGPCRATQGHQYRVYLFLILFFVASRIGLVLAGVRFDMSPLFWFFQYLDPQELRVHLFESLVYLHSQPPGFNLFLGTVLSLCRGIEQPAFHAIYMLIGLSLMLMLYHILVMLAIPRWVAFGLSLFFIVSPPVLLYENWLFYTYPVTCLILASTLALEHYARHGKWSSGLAFFAICSLVVLTRTLFHALWFTGLVVGAFIMIKGSRIKTVLCALLPFLCIVGLYAKNAWIFKQPNLSSWFGMNLYKMTLSVPLPEIKRLVAENELNEIALIMPFQSPENYDKLALFDTTTGIPVLDMRYKSSGYPNFNHIGYISVSQQYKSAAYTLIRKYPHLYLLSVLKAFYAYLRPSSDSLIFRGNNRQRLKPWVEFYEQWFAGNILYHVWHTTFSNRYNDARTVHINLLYLYVPVLLLWGAILILRGKKILNLDQRAIIVCAYIMYTIMFAMIAGNLIETSENMRFRFLVVPLFYILAATLLTFFLKRRK